MSAVRLVHDRSEVAGAVATLVDVREAVRGVMPHQSDVKLCMTADNEVLVEVLITTYEDRETALFNIRTGLVPGYTFHGVSHRLEHGSRGRHRICALLDV